MQIQFVNYSFTYNEHNEYALRNINLTIKPGEFILLLGSSGSGKSTLLKQIKSELAHGGEAEGQILYDGKLATAYSAIEKAMNIGYVFQNPHHQIVSDVVWRELAFGLESIGVESDKIRRKMADITSYFGLENLYRRETSTLSGGQKQLVNLASILAMEPKVIVLDEPTAQLDPIAAQKLIQMVKQINKEFGITVVIAEHRIDELLQHVDKVYVMEDGVISKGYIPSTITEHIHKGHPLFKCLPAPLQLYELYGCRKMDAPLSVIEGRHWLHQMDRGRILDNSNTLKQLNKRERLLIKEISFGYEQKREPILQHLSASFYEGEVFTIVGGNGAGKSTLLRLIQGLEKPWRGKIKKVNKHDKIIFLPQNPALLFSQQTIYEDLLQVAEPVQIQEIAKQWHFTDYLHSHSEDLSGGQLQLMALAKVILTKPSILLLDEPTKAMDVTMKNRIARYIKDLAKNGVTIIIVTHDLELAASYSDRCAFLFDGHIIAIAQPNEFFSSQHYYTTTMYKLTRGYMESVVSIEGITICEKD